MKNCIANRFSEDNIWKSKFLRKTRIVTLFLLLLLVGVTQTFALGNYEISDRQVELTSMLKTGIEQQKTVSGKVTDNSGTALPGVTVVVKGTTRGTITDTDGNYTLPNVPSDATLVFSFLGMKTREIVVRNQTTVNVTMEEEAIELEEVVAVGYGTMRRSDLTGAVSSVRVEDMDKVVKTSFDQALQGMAAGVLVTQNSAQPGGSVSIRVRGVTSLNSGNEPLYVIDGVPVEGGEFSAGANYGPGISVLSSINPNDIENIEILKDASSTAVYGARGANGVVVITTKQGKPGIGTVTLNASTSFQRAANFPDVLNAREYMEVVNQALLNDNNGDEELASQYDRWFTQEEKDSIGEGTNWLDQISRTGVIQNYNLSASGGRDKLSYFLSVGHSSTEGVIKKSNFKRSSVRLNLRNQFTKKIVVGGNISVSDYNANFIRTEAEGQNAGVSGVMYAAQFYQPTAPVYSLTDENYYVDDYLSSSNPLAMVTEVTNSSRGLNVLGNVFLEYNLIKDLNFRSNGAFNINNTRGNFYAPKETTYQGSLNGGIARLSFFSSRNFTNTNQLNYYKKIGQHTINALGVIELIKGDSYQVINHVSGFQNDVLREHDLSSGTIVSPPNNYTQEYSLLSYVARVNYNFANKYLLTVSGRYDGSSRFGKNNKYAFFPSASVAWRLNNENFLKDVHFIDQLKLRLSYGVAGNQNIPLYSSTSPLESDSYILGNNLVTGFHASRIANPNLRWEKREQTNIGIDFGIFKSRIFGTLEFYNDLTKDLLMAKQVPTSSGFPSVISNIGNIRNQGIELTLNTVNIDKKFQWQTSFNIAFPKTTVEDLGGDSYMFAGMNNWLVKNTQIVEVGKPIGQFYGYIYDGFAESEEEVAFTINQTFVGDYKFKDISGPDGEPDGTINEYDKTVIGNAMPKFFGGMTNTFSYKNFELSVFLQGTYGNDIMNVSRLRLESSAPLSNLMRSALNAWTPGTDNANAKVRILSFRNITPVQSSFIVEDGSYLRLKNVTLAYNIPKRMTHSIGLSNIQINVSGQNLFVITNYSGIDPEVDALRNNSLSFGHDFYGYPQSKIITTGITVTF